jgi:hypothetical protein
VNLHRSVARVLPVVEEAELSAGAELHSRYMVKNDYIGHSEERGNPWFTEEGLLAAQRGNVFASSSDYEPAVPINFWMVGPFHQIGIIDPRLAASGYGDYHEAIGRIHFGATLNVLSRRDREVSAADYPVFYPGNGQVMPNLRYTGGESPDPLAPCPGFSVPTGAPIAIQLGPGNVTPQVRSSELARGGQAVPHCRFDQTTTALDALGRQVLGSRNAIILMPRQPLEPNTEYAVRLDTNGAVHAWSFTTGRGAIAALLELPMVPRPWEWLR